MAKCSTCGGEKYITKDNGKKKVVCPACDGTGK